MQLHIFNPSHDEALAAHYPYYYPSTIARTLGQERALLPLLWAAPGDGVWVGDGLTDPERQDLPGWRTDVRRLCRRELTPTLWAQVTKIEPWGWDLLLRHQLRKAGAPEHLLPDDAWLERLRTLSSRATTTRCLPQLVRRLQAAGLRAVGASALVSSAAEWAQALRQWPEVAVKSLWSCSGRGVFRVQGAPTESDEGRLRRLLHTQGAVEVEPWWDALLQFALEYHMADGGTPVFDGLSCFATIASGTYAGNVVAPQAVLEAQVARALDCPHWLQPVLDACQPVWADVLAADYRGPFGVDMMVVRTAQGPALLPCVEVNLRRTMGHAALSLARQGWLPDSLPPALRGWWLTPRADEVFSAMGQ